MAFISVGAMLASWRDVRLRHALLVACFLAATLYAIKFGMYFILLATALSGVYLPASARARLSSLRPATAVLCLIFTGWMVFFASREGFLKKGDVQPGLEPREAVAFVAEKRPPPPLFNSFE